MPERQNYSIGLKGNLLPNESKILELKYTGKRFGEMNDDERWFAAQTILLKIHAIKGWSIPISELMDILIDQFQQKLNEGYKNVTIAEMEYAFRNNIDTKDWGKSLNLSLIDEVMIPYLENRYDLSSQEESLKKNKMIEEKKELTDQEKQEWIDEWKNKQDINLELIPIIFYDYLNKQTILNVNSQDKFDYFDKAASQIKAILYTNMGSCKTNDAILELKEFEDMEKNGFHGKLKDKIINRAKRLIVFDYLKKTNERNNDAISS